MMLGCLRPQAILFVVAAPPPGSSCKEEARGPKTITCLIEKWYYHPGPT